MEWLTPELIETLVSTGLTPVVVLLVLAYYFNGTRRYINHIPEIMEQVKELGRLARSNREDIIVLKTRLEVDTTIRED